MTKSQITSVLLFRFNIWKDDLKAGLLRVLKLDISQPLQQLKPMQHWRNDISDRDWELFEKFSAVCNLSCFPHLTHHLLHIWVVGQWKIWIFETQESGFVIS